MVAHTCNCSSVLAPFSHDKAFRHRTLFFVRSPASVAGPTASALQMKSGRSFCWVAWALTSWKASTTMPKNSAATSHQTTGPYILLYLLAAGTVGLNAKTPSLKSSNNSEPAASNVFALAPMRT
eukprot:10454247-Alexandrium_andersonii.AAC.2